MGYWRKSRSYGVNGLVLGPRQNTGLKLEFYKVRQRDPSGPLSFTTVFSFTFPFFFHFRLASGIIREFFGDFRLVDVFFPVVNGLRHTSPTRRILHVPGLLDCGGFSASKGPLSSANVLPYSPCA